ncbi:MAG: pentapeptide repeat-containing protein [Candidatus Pedobacter colombiensis]|uniref:Pentapeptide repeat-containing protein n=1 Tax=Candidatus Pedobacter colombiensis TaxID=3121371 RepID=A0AAJ5WBF4_9SPHI|nr:pentapeptide repeat-containing protein [Pedobacter sp.]WEK20938.1 MAG: pentapeptide repeat-containing protein [Pedobacter sp.]
MNNNETTVHEGKTFTGINYAEKQLKNREFINCEFISCDFSKSDLSHNDFMNCHFKQCNFSLTIVIGTGFKDATFTGCKVLGIDFSKCNKFLFSFSFEQCQLDYSTFYGTKLRKTKFIECSLKETDFEATDLTSAIFHNCEMSGATFVRSILEKADFRTARNFSLDPAVNKVKQAKFSAMNLTGLLYQYNLDIDYNH